MSDSTGKERIDVLLVEQGHFDSREKAKAAVMAGLVFLEGVRLEKAGMKVPANSKFTVKGELHPYVSRGGLKLEKAIRHFGLDLAGAVMIDIGASTGGFTDCALRHGAAFVYAIDVGYNQLDWSLRKDERVRVMERVNFRYVTPADLVGPQPTFAATDVSFISLRLILPPLKPLLAPGSKLVALIKPQFEAGRELVGKNGIVREPNVHRDVLRTVVGFAAAEGYVLEGLTYSPITGGEGNIEFLALWRFDASGAELPANVDDLVEAVVREAHETLHRS
ncbi:TlyA family RNA methyltransferase [Paenibacillus sp.]|uniref:TlyA family RNA methyltransferase n=1 Tax=Paenibacillus sp. TaxID=58172 RepID=UPI002D336067|nr:TlyA family RNA methyltransferase [Paenibacillus sp.]HZG85134.1 TlyA family RNA methyltransferase [Paenibacillus sp.]